MINWNELREEYIRGGITQGALAERYGDLEALTKATVEEIAELDDFGNITAECVVNFFSHPQNIALCRRLAEAGVDGIQMDKLPVEDMAALVPELRAINPHVTLIAAGGVNISNAQAYAATGVDGLATTCLHFAKPLDMSVRMTAL